MAGVEYSIGTKCFSQETQLNCLGIRIRVLGFRVRGRIQQSSRASTPHYLNTSAFDPVNLRSKSLSPKPLCHKLIRSLLSRPRPRHPCTDPRLSNVLAPSETKQLIALTERYSSAFGRKSDRAGRVWVFRLNEYIRSIPLKVIAPFYGAHRALIYLHQSAVVPITG